jgi:hypothetical protein
VKCPDKSDTLVSEKYSRRIIGWDLTPLADARKGVRISRRASLSKIFIRCLGSIWTLPFQKLELHTYLICLQTAG